MNISGDRTEATKYTFIKKGIILAAFFKAPRDIFAYQVSGDDTHTYT